MKSFKSATLTLSFLLLLQMTYKSQILSQDFNSGLPATWSMMPAATWSVDPTLGISGSSCIINANIGSTSATASISTPTLNLSSITNLTITFKGAVTKSNFVSPEISLLYNAGSGAQFLASWSSGFNPNATYTISEGFETQSPLNSQNVIWETCTHTVAVISGTSVRFIFEINNQNGGYALIDDVVITGKTFLTAGFNKSDQAVSISVFPNPVTDKKITVTGINLKSVRVSDQLGRILPVQSTQVSDALELDLSAYAKGIYQVTVLSKENTVTHKKIILE